MKHYRNFRQYILPTFFLLAMTGVFAPEIKAQCTGDGSAKFKQAVESLTSAEEVVLGAARTNLFAGWCTTYTNWIEQMKKPPFAMQKEYDEGLSFPQAVVFLKKFIAQPERADYRVRIINSAVYEVYGRAPTAVEQATWDAQIRTQKAWFMTILSGEIKNLNDPNSEKNLHRNRPMMIARAFLNSFGRSPTAAELKEWQPRSEHYKLIIEIKRKHLYSANGADDYVKTLKNVLKYEYRIAKTKTVPPGAKPSFFDDEAKKMMPLYTNKRLIFSEMLGQPNFEKYLAALAAVEKPLLLETK